MAVNTGLLVLGLAGAAGLGYVVMNADKAAAPKKDTGVPASSAGVGEPLIMDRTAATQIVKGSKAFIAITDPANPSIATVMPAAGGIAPKGQSLQEWLIAFNTDGAPGVGVGNLGKTILASVNPIQAGTQKAVVFVASPDINKTLELTASNGSSMAVLAFRNEVLKMLADNTGMIDPSDDKPQGGFPNNAGQAIAAAKAAALKAITAAVDAGKPAAEVLAAIKKAFDLGATPAETDAAQAAGKIQGFRYVIQSGIGGPHNHTIKLIGANEAAQGFRWKQLGPANPDLPNLLTGSGGGPQWQIGQKIKLPHSWDAAISAELFKAGSIPGLIVPGQVGRAARRHHDWTKVGTVHAHAA